MWTCRVPEPGYKPLALTIARHEVRAPKHESRAHAHSPYRRVSDRPTILEMLALRRAAKRVVELTETMLRSLLPVTAGRTGPLGFCVAMVGPGPEEARNLVERVVGQVQGVLPDGLELVAT